MNRVFNAPFDEPTYLDGTPLPFGGTTIYTHVSDAGVIRHWHIEKLLKLTVGLERIAAPIEPNMVRTIIEKRGIERRRVDRLSTVHLMAPIIFVELEREAPHEPPVSHLLVDGNHRFVRAHEMGIKTLPAVIVPRHLSDTALIIGLPDVSGIEVHKTESGIR